MKILVVADVHGETQKLNELAQTVDPKTIDILVCPGNMTDMFTAGQDFNQLDVADMVIQKLLLFKKPVLCVPGNHDPYEIVDVFEEYGVNLHNTHKKVRGVDFIGFGGAPTPFNTLFEPTEEETKDGLEAAWQGAKPPQFVLVTHNPPIGTKLDQLTSGEHVGSQAIRDFILHKKPLLAISAHIHEGRGDERVGETVCFNPGPLKDGHYGIVTIEGKVVKCETKRLPQHTQKEKAT